MARCSHDLVGFGCALQIWVADSAPHVTVLTFPFYRGSMEGGDGKAPRLVALRPSPEGYPWFFLNGSCGPILAQENSHGVVRVCAGRWKFLPIVPSTISGVTSP